MATVQQKDAIRQHVWSLLDQKGVARSGSARGKIPDFFGSDKCADHLGSLRAWTTAVAVKSNPDKAQLPVRERALREGKMLFMAVPRMASLHPFYRLDPTKIEIPPMEAASSRGAELVASKVGVDDMTQIDIVVCGSVAVNRNGARLGKGAGYSDLEIALLVQGGLIGPDTVIVTTVHSLQVVNTPIPEGKHDFPMDLIVTEQDVIECPSRKRPSGVIWENLNSEKISQIPILGELAKSRKST